MDLQVDNEILRDFILEANEILEQLNGQLVDLEQQPDDFDLLDAIFRGFHTIKGGAGFLRIEALVELCHRAEDLLNLLRQGRRRIDAHLMDVVFGVLDAVNVMFLQVRQGVVPESAAPALITNLHTLLEYENGCLADNRPEEPMGDLCGRIASRVAPQQNTRKDCVANSVQPDEIADEEFEALFDQIHGAGRVFGIQDKAQFGYEDERRTPISDNQSANSDNRQSAKKQAAQAISTDGEHAGAMREPVTEASGSEAEKAIEAVGETTVRVSTGQLDDIMNMVGELVLVRNRLRTLKEALADDDVTAAVSKLDVVTSDLQLAVMKTRMQPIKKVFGRFPRLVRDLARSLRKEVELEMHGEETDLDKNLVEALADPLLHLVRNAVDHGVEAPEERELRGKSRKGRIILSAVQEGDHILLSIEDDGNGLDPDVLRGTAVAKGIMDEEAAARLEEKDCFNLIFAPGFSTRTEISDVSGRGVGMDVVKTRLTQINGSLEIDSNIGRGTAITIKLPLTLAILPTLMVTLGCQPYALPLASVVEIFDLDSRRTNRVDGQLTVMLRDRALPLFYLRRWFVQDGSAEHFREPENGHVVVVTVGTKQVGLVVDQLVGQEEVVIKPLGAFLQGLEGLAGATITGDGKIALILDVPGLLRKYGRTKSSGRVVRESRGQFRGQIQSAVG